MARLFGDRPADAVAIVEAPVSRSYARKARIAFVSVTAVAGALGAVSLATVMAVVPALALGSLAGAACGLAVAVLVRVWPVLRVLWHWAAEIAALLTVLGSASVLAQVMHRALALGVVVGAAGLLAVIGPVRRRVVAWGWCAVVRHRLRLCFAEFVRAAARVSPGCLPLILLARPTPAGERVWVWLRPGLDLAELEGRVDKLAVACWASEVRVVRASDRYAALVRVDITRRDPLTALVASPLAPAAGPTGAPVAPPAREWLGLDLPDVPEELPDPPRVGARR
jgi:hypothetical protein